MTASLTASAARRIALAAQGLAAGRPDGAVTARQVGRAFDRIRLLQIDSANVLTRSHYLPFFSRLGDYDADILHRFAGRAPRRMMEYWAHEASYIRPGDFADLRVWQRRTWVGADDLDAGLRQDLSARVLHELASGPPMTARTLARRIGHFEDRRTDGWGWNWSAVKRVLEDLFEQGLVSSAARSSQFERLYAPTASVLPPAVRRAAAPDPDEAMVRLVEAAASAHGIGTVRCFADYFRVPVRRARSAVEALVTDGILERVTVDGWAGPLYLHAAAARPRRAVGRALLSPFDSMVFERRRLQDLFGFRYRLEIYTPAARRTYGYYVLPFLLRDRMVARVDLKADRLHGRLLVRSSHAEDQAPPDTASELAAELALMARWLRLDDVVVEPVGDLAGALDASMRAGAGTEARVRSSLT